MEINLTDRSIHEFKVRDEDRKLYLGGKGLGLKLLYDRLQLGIDPLDEENIIAFMMGVFMGTGAPCSGRFAAATKSPLTGIMASSSCGGPFGMAYKTAGYDGFLPGLNIDDLLICFQSAYSRFHNHIQYYEIGGIVSHIFNSVFPAGGCYWLVA